MLDCQWGVMQFSCCVAVAVTAVVLAYGETSQSVAAKATERIGARDFQSAAKMLAEFLQQSGGDAELWNLLGISESEMQNYPAARDAFTRGLKLAPDSVALNENAGFLYFRQGDYDAAKQYLSKAVALGSEKPGVAYSLAASRIRTGDEKGGLDALVRLEPLLKDQAAYWAERGWVELRAEPARAAASFDRALALAPDDPRALNGAASAAESQQQNEKALSFLLRAKKAHPGDIRTLLHFGTLCLRGDLSVDALDAFEKAHRLSPTNNLALFMYARAEIAFQQWQKSHDLFTEFDRRVPGYAPAQYALGWIDVKLSRAEEAREHLEKSLALDASQLDARYELGQLDLDEGRLADAERELGAVLRAQPRHAKANIALGDLLMRNGDVAGAKARYQAAIEADPESGPAHYKLSVVLARLNEPDAAAKERQIGVSLNADARKKSRTVLVLAEPDGRLLTGEPRRRGGE